MRKGVIALDVGSQRIGVAVTDELEIATYPLETVEGALDKRLSRIAEIVIERSVSTVVVGMPYHFSGEMSERGIEVEKFCSKLKSKVQREQGFELELVYLDERLTSKEAERFLSGSKLKNKERSRAADKIAAAIILEGYLLSKNR